ncbi:MAG: hypothetical protein ACTTJH_03365 [Bacteroidales bacterium]
MTRSNSKMMFMNNKNIITNTTPHGTDNNILSINRYITTLTHDRISCE